MNSRFSCLNSSKQSTFYQEQKHLMINQLIDIPQSIDHNSQLPAREEMNSFLRKCYHKEIKNKTKLKANKGEDTFDQTQTVQEEIMDKQFLRQSWVHNQNTREKWVSNVGGTAQTTQNSPNKKQGSHQRLTCMLDSFFRSQNRQSFHQQGSSLHNTVHGEFFSQNNSLVNNYNNQTGEKNKIETNQSSSNQKALNKSITQTQFNFQPINPQQIQAAMIKNVFQSQSTLELIENKNQNYLYGKEDQIVEDIDHPTIRRAQNRKLSMIMENSKRNPTFIDLEQQQTFFKPGSNRKSTLLINLTKTNLQPPSPDQMEESDPNDIYQFTPSKFSLPEIDLSSPVLYHAPGIWNNEREYIKINDQYKLQLGFETKIVNKFNIEYTPISPMQQQSGRNLVALKKVLSRKITEIPFDFEFYVEKVIKSVIDEMDQDEVFLQTIYDFCMLNQEEFSFYLGFFFRNLGQQQNEDNDILAFFQLSHDLINRLRDIMQRTLRENNIHENIRKELLDQFNQKCVLIMPSNLLEEIGGYKQIKKIILKFIEQYYSYSEEEKALAMAKLDDTTFIVGAMIMENAEEIPNYVVSRISGFSLSSVQFFVAKKTIWRILISAFAFPAPKALLIIEKLQKLRTLITRWVIDFRNNAHIDAHVVVLMKTSKIIGPLIRGFTKAKLTQISQVTLEWLYGAYNSRFYLQSLKQLIGKTPDKAILHDMEQFVLNALSVYVQEFNEEQKKTMIAQFEKLRKIELFQNEFQDLIKDRDEIMEELANWSRDEILQYKQTGNIIQIEDIVDCQFLVVFFTFFLNDFDVFQLIDVEVSFAYFSVTKLHLRIWTKGLTIILQQRGHQKSIIDEFMTFLQFIFSINDQAEWGYFLDKL